MCFSLLKKTVVRLVCKICSRWGIKVIVTAIKKRNCFGSSYINNNRIVQLSWHLDLAAGFYYKTLKINIPLFQASSLYHSILNHNLCRHHLVESDMETL